MAKYIAMLTNGGKQIDITLIKNITTKEGTNIDRTEINSYIKNKLGIKDVVNENLDIKEENLKAILEGMKSVTTETRGNRIFSFSRF